MYEMTGHPRHICRPVIARIAGLFPAGERSGEEACFIGSAGGIPASCRLVLSSGPASRDPAPDGLPTLELADTSGLAPGDIVMAHPEGLLVKLYDNSTPDNALFVTSACNLRCIMCPQPPESVENDCLAVAQEVIRLMPPTCQAIAVTGGEPTMLGDRLFDIVGLLSERMPMTRVHLLTNGRAFNRQSEVEKLKAVGHPLISAGIPLYGDCPAVHDRLTGVHGSFSETVMGMLRLANAGIPVELRTVVMSQNVARLPRWAEFVWRSMSFVSQVSIMGMECTGHARERAAELWIDPKDYCPVLEKAVAHLALCGMNVSIFNEQLCVLPRSLWKYAASSISAWKRSYPAVCGSCDCMGRCGGVFSTSGDRISRAIQPIKLQDSP